MSADLDPATKRWLVGEAETTLDRVKKDRDFGRQTSQLRNMLQIVQTESEIPVLRNFIRYQTGRKATQKFWQLIYDDVLKTLAEIETRFPGEQARRRALQSYFGYLVRHYVYLNEAQRQTAAASHPPRQART